MKGFIEVNCIESINNSAPMIKKEERQIALKPEFILGFADNYIAIKGCQEITLKVEETYEEIKQKIKEATVEFEDFENRPYSHICYECRQFTNCEIKQRYRDKSLFACGSFIKK